MPAREVYSHRSSSGRVLRNQKVPRPRRISTHRPRPPHDRALVAPCYYPGNHTLKAHQSFPESWMTFIEGDSSSDYILRMAAPGQNQGATQAPTAPSQPSRPGHRYRGGRARRGRGIERDSGVAGDAGPATSEPGPEDDQASTVRGGRGRAQGRPRGDAARQSAMAPQRTFGGRLTSSTPTAGSSLSGDAPAFVPGKPVAQRR